MSSAIIEPLPSRPGQESSSVPARQTSIDVYRGFVMFLMMAEVLRLSRVARAVPESGVWQFLAYHQSHVEWIGCSLHDLIQPSFSFLVGVALPYSLANRIARGNKPGLLAWHALWRSVVLILLGVFLRSTGKTQTNWTFEDTLSQIGLGYFLLFLLGFRSARTQWMALGLILAGYWAAFALYPLPPPGFDYAAVGVPEQWHEHLMTGFAAHWNKNSNLAWAFDTWFLNLFPREKVFRFNGGGYATLSFIPTLATMILGLLAGGVLRSERSSKGKMQFLLIAGGLGLLTGWAAGWLGLCPVVKRIWTPSWVLFSGGWCLIFTAGFYSVVDVAGYRRWAFPLLVIGMNSIAAYCMAHLWEGFIGDNLRTNFGSRVFELFGKPYVSLIHGGAVLLVLWLILYWMYRRRLFLKI